MVRFIIYDIQQKIVRNLTEITGELCNISFKDERTKRGFRFGSEKSVFCSRIKGLPRVIKISDVKIVVEENMEIKYENMELKNNCYKSQLMIT